jgi:hypothetical protein
MISCPLCGLFLLLCLLFFVVPSIKCGKVMLHQKLWFSRGKLCSREFLLGRTWQREGWFFRELMLCVVCGGGVKTEDHLFLMCPLAWSIWVQVYMWFGVVEVFPGSIYFLFVGFFSSFKRGKKPLKGTMMVWHAVMWVLIWCVRNHKIISDKSIVLEDVFERIKCISWKCLLARKPNSHCIMSGV